MAASGDQRGVSVRAQVALLDLRLPIGALFAIYGILLAGYGIFSASPDAKSALPIECVWGLILLAFGSSMLVSYVHSRRSTPESE